jgi:hypothetical protein
LLQTTWRNCIRLSTVDDPLFLHSAFPTEAADAVFFGPVHRRTSAKPYSTRLGESDGIFCQRATPDFRPKISRYYRFATAKWQMRAPALAAPPRRTALLLQLQSLKLDPLLIELVLQRPQLQIALRRRWLKQALLVELLLLLVLTKLKVLQLLLRRPGGLRKRHGGKREN